MLCCLRLSHSPSLTPEPGSVRACMCNNNLRILMRARAFEHTLYIMHIKVGIKYFACCARGIASHIVYATTATAR